MKLDALENAIHRLTLVVVGFAGLATVIAISAVLALFRSQAALERALNERAVMVVPGAVSGEYIAGLSEENLKGVARYLAQLGTSFTPGNFTSRMNEMMAYADDSYLPELANQIRKLETEVVAQAQGRYFLPETTTEKLAVLGKNTFEYTVSGPWAFSAGGLPLTNDDTGTVAVRFRLGQPDAKNKYGVKVLGYAAARTKGASK